MGLQFKTPELAEIATRLGVTEAALSGLMGHQIEEARKRLDALKADVKKRYRELAFQLHPDRNAGDDTEFKKLSGAWLMLEPWLAALEIRPQPPAPPPMIIIQFGGFQGAQTGFSTGSATTSTGSGFYGGFFF